MLGVGGLSLRHPTPNTQHPAIQDRRPGALPGKWRTGVPGAHRSAGEGARVPDRVGGDRGGTPSASGGAGVRGAGARGCPRRNTAGGVRRGEEGTGNREQGTGRHRQRYGIPVTCHLSPVTSRAARFPPGTAARLHGAKRVCGALCAAADAERQARPPRAAGA